ncbi:uncharacterized protein LOC135945617 [Cloeon dipterum]|uniref:uncharacterized protein LOC135945617 n=1 Tax=Cloeon dipterum TaxID=197152 RepID=UPI0032207885
MTTSCVVVTDNDAATKAAFNKQSHLTWLSCAVHDANLAVKQTLQSAALPNEIKVAIEACKEIVRYVKKAQLNSKLLELGKKSLKQECETRFNSLWNMVRSVNDAMAALPEVLPIERRGGLPKLTKPSFTELISILSHFDALTRELSASKVPTLFLKPLWKKELMKLLNEKSKDRSISAAGQKVASMLMDSVESKVQLQTLHFCATILHPQFKYFVQREYGAECHNEAADFLESKMMPDCAQHFQDLLGDGIEDCQRQPNNLLGNSSSEQQIPMSHVNIWDRIQSYGCGSSSSGLSEDFTAFTSHAEELASWMCVPERKLEGKSILNYWREQKHHPILAATALFIHSIPCSSIPSERLFSVSGRITADPRRSSLSADKLSKLCVINSFKKNGGKIE